MSWYRRIDIRMHGDKRVRELSDPQPCGKYLWMYLLTGPHTINGLPGLFPVARADLACRLKWSLKDFDRVWNEFSDGEQRPMAVADWDSHVVWVPRVIAYNLPDAANNIKGWTQSFSAVPECALLYDWADNVYAVLKAERPHLVTCFKESFGTSLGTPFGTGFGTPFGTPYRTTQPQPQPQPQPQKESGTAQLEIDAAPAAAGQCATRGDGSKAPGRPVQQPDPLPIAGPEDRVAKAGPGQPRRYVWQTVLQEGHDPVLDQIVVMMPTKTGDRPITEAEVREWEKLYGNIDVRGKLNHMCGHWGSKPLSHRKTMRGIKTSINTWLAKDSDRGSTQTRTGGNPKHSHRARNEQIIRETLKGKS